MTNQNHEIILQDLLRRMNNMLRPGVVAQVDYDKAKVRVRLAEGDVAKGIKPFVTGWLSYFAKRAGNTIDWDPPEAGEQCLVLSPGGELSGGFVLTGLYSNAHPAPSKDSKVSLRRFADGLECSYDQAGHTFTVSRPTGLRLVVKAERMEFNTEKAAIKNSAGHEVIDLFSKALESLSNSSTATMMGPQKMLPAAVELPLINAKLSAFKETANAPEGN